jgi:hypothetical protein
LRETDKANLLQGARTYQTRGTRPRFVVKKALANSVRLARRRHAEGRYRAFDNNSITIEITIN